MYELTTQQENIWNLQSYYADTSISNISGLLQFKELLDIDILKEAINMYVKYQEGARLRFVKNGNQVRQYVAEYEPFDIPVEQFEDLSHMRKFANKEARVPYDFGENDEASGQMFRFTIYKTTDTCGIIIHMNHLISDAWTLSLFCKTVIKYYKMLVNGSSEEILAASYLEYIQKEKQYISSDKFQKDVEYWNNRFKEMPIRKRIKPEGKEESGISSMRLTKIIEKESASVIHEFCFKTGYSPAIVFESVILAYLNCINEPRKETIIGVPVLNRTGKDKQIAGMFISTMPLGITVEQADTMLQVCQKVSASHFQLFRHQKFPYNTILRNVRQTHGFEGNLYDVMVSYQNAVVGETEEMDYETEWLSNGYSEISMAFHIDDRDENGCFTVNMDVQEELFSKEEADWLLKRILFIVDTVVKNGNMTVEEIPLMSEEEYELIVHKFNNTKVVYDDTLCVHEVFEKQAVLYGEKTAVICDGKKMSYHELSVMSDKVAIFLRQHGIEKGNIVPLLSIRSPYVIVAMLGIMKAGAAYLPVDYQYPLERIEYMLKEAGAGLTLCCGEKCKKLCEKLGVRTFSLENISYDSISGVKPENINTPDDIAYVIFTSGSTGMPKGTMLKHKGLVNFSHHTEDSINIDRCFQNNVFMGCNTVLAIGSFSFDISLVELFLPLLNGLTVSLATEEQVNEAECLAKVIVEEQVDFIHTTPTRMAYYMESQVFVRALTGMKTILVAGEALPQELHNRIVKATTARLFNGYGPTETTIGATFSRMDNKQKVTIGKPVANTQIYIVNRENRLCPIGVAGELCISGKGVGAGYLNRPELTAEKFVSNPFVNTENQQGTVMYRTGDLARWREDGEIEFLGRIDTQVKIRGLRIELGEIESKMAGFPNIDLCAVADKKDEKGRQLLVGYYTSKEPVCEQDLRKYLLESLPNYMVPNYFMWLEQLPISISGKIDRKNLPMPDLSKRVTEYVSPTTELEKLLCELYEKILNLEHVGIEEHFFDIGGDSLTAMAMISELSEHYKGVSLQWVFEKPVLKDFAKFIEKNLGISYEKSDNVTFQKNYTEQSYKKYEKYRSILRENWEIQQNEKVLEYNTHSTECMLKKTSKEGIIITGATGFLGAHILKEILGWKKTEVYCLVRGKDDLDAKIRLKQVMENYFDKTIADCINDEYGVHVIACDIVEQPMKSVKTILERYPSKIKKILHSAALVKHYGEYKLFYSINVKGTNNMLAVAKELGVEFLHISTESVGGLYVEEGIAIQDAKNVQRFTEQDLYIRQNMDNVYIRSKFEAECCVMDYIIAGGQARIFRVGNLTNRYSDGKFQNNFTENAFLRRMYTFLSLGVYPDVLDDVLFEFSPVDETARAIAVLASSNDNYKPCVYHVSHSRSMTYRYFAKILEQYGEVLCAIPVKKFMALLQLGNVSHDYLKNDLHEVKKLLTYTTVITVNDKTSAYLRKLGFVWKEIDEKYIKQYIKYVETLEL